MFEKEFKDYYHAKDVLNKKVLEYLDSLNEEFKHPDFGVWVQIDNEDIFIAKIGNQQLETEDGFEIDYRYFTTDQRIDLLNEIITYHNDVSNNRWGE